MSNQKCSACRYFEQFAGLENGYCNGLPPTIYVGGSQSSPKVKANHMACSLFAKLEQDEKPAIRTKTDPETPGDAAKLARQTAAVASKRQSEIQKKPLA